MAIMPNMKDWFDLRALCLIPFYFSFFDNILSYA